MTTATMPEPTCTTENGLSIGFLGCGTIASSIATAIATQTTIPVARISVTRRSRTKSEQLQKTFPSLVSVHDDNQVIVDQSLIIFVCVLPEQANAILRSVKFDSNKHKLVSIVATADLSDLADYSNLPLSNIVKMICTPSIAQREGACIVYPRQQESSSTATLLIQLFDAISHNACVQCDSNEQMTTLMSTMCVMGPVYGILKTHRDWMISKGIAKRDASKLVRKQYQAIVKDVNNNNNNISSSEEEEEDRLEELIEEQTPGGINQQALDNLVRLGGLEAYARSLDAIASRINGTSNGEVVVVGE